MKKILYILLSIPVLALAQSTDQNWVKSITYKDTTKTSISSPTPAQAVVQVNYFDGLGRPIQQISHAQSNSGKDIVTHIEYDQFGRQIREYLPFISSSSASLNIKSNEVSSFYGSNNSSLTGNLNFETTQFPFSEKELEASPLNRILKQGAPGEDWKLTSGHEIKLDYQTNSTNEVKKYKATVTWNTTNGLYDITFVDDGYFALEELYKSITKDENWTSGNNNTTQEFKDKDGKVVLKRTFSDYRDINGNLIESATKHDTYYVYDKFGNLTYVIPPAVSGSVDQAKLDNMCYQYKYDNRNRLVEKKLPGKQWEYIVYDKLDRVVASGPAFNPYGTSTIGWLITKYDLLNRPIYTAWYNSAASTSYDRKTLQYSYNNATVFSESKVTSANTIDGISVKYTNNITPTTFILLTVNYYDNYDYPSAPNVLTTLPDSTFPIATSVKGLATGSWVRVLDVAGSTTNELSYTIYDKKFRPVRSYTKNYLGGYTQVDSKIDWAGKTQYTITKHRRTSTAIEVVTKDSFEYSNQDRLTKHYQQINTDPVQLISLNTYDELGQLISKKVGSQDVTGADALQKVDYNYNIRGWLKSINDVTDLTPSGNETDLFAFKINYNQLESVSNSNALFNGNIAETLWRTNADDFKRKYEYHYDNLNRLLQANYNKPDINGTLDNYLEHLTYDKNGNIQNVIRNGNVDPSGGAPVNQIDNLVYTYDANNINQLKKVNDLSNSPQGFNQNNDIATGDVDAAMNDHSDDYTYDLNGNLKTDENKGINEITYNHLNLPTFIKFVGVTNGTITYIYNALGQKVKKIVYDGGTVDTEYLSGFQYEKSVLQFFPHAEGYVKGSATIGRGGALVKYNFNYVFNYTDHLGNIRLSYAQDPLNHNNLKILEENHYYPFGLKHQNYNIEKLDFDTFPETGVEIVPTNNPMYKYKVNNREWQDELELNVTAMDFRQYDNAIGRFNGIDVLAESSSSTTPYHFGYNNPVFWADPSGLKSVPWGSSGSQNLINSVWDYTPNGVNSSWTNNGTGFSWGNQNIGYDGNETLPPIFIQGTKSRRTGRFLGFKSDNMVGGFKYGLAERARDQAYQYGSAYQTRRDKIASRQLDEFQSGLEYLGTFDPVGVIDGFNAIGYALRGQKGKAIISAVAILPFGDLLKGAKQSHHIIPQAVYKKFADELTDVMKLHGVANRVDLPVPFHLGSHKQYNDFVTNAINGLRNDVGITPGSIEALQGQMREMINDALQSGEKLNDYFRQFNN